MKVIMSLETEEMSSFQSACDECCFYDACMQTQDIPRDFTDACKDGDEGYWSLEHI